MAAKASSRAIEKHRVVSPSEWLKHRKRLLAKEKAFTHQRERLSRERRSLPWVKVEKDYNFDGPKGYESLADLFEGRSQLVIYHFMFDPRDKLGCPHCSFWADNFDGIVVHLKHRDVTMLAISRAPMAKINAFKKRMGWTFKWVSSNKSDFNYDYQVSFTEEAVRSGNAYYNYRTMAVPCRDFPGVSVFYRDARGNVFHTYSSYGRGIDMVNNAYHYLDMVPKGRDEDPERPQSWVRYHDRYPASAK